MEEKKNDAVKPLPPTPGSIGSQEQPVTAFILSLVAGVLFLLGSLMPLLFMNSFGDMSSMMEGYDGSGMMGDIDRTGMVDAGFIALRILGLVFAGVVLYSAIKLNSSSVQHVTWGSLILVFSILSVFTSWGGFGIGLILGVIGGGLAIAWKPTITLSNSLPTGRSCPNCGRSIAMDASFCSYCGQQLPA